jgi:aminopeptidase N
VNPTSTLTALLVGVCLTGGAAAQAGSARWHDYPEADALRYEIELVLDPALPDVRGRVRYVFRATRDLAAVRLDCREGPEWSVAFFQEGELAARREGDRLQVELEEPVAAGEEFSFRAELAGAPVDGLYFGKTRYGVPCVYTDHYAVRARGWLPCEDHPSDRATFALRIAVPEDLGVVFTGRMTRVERDGAPTDWHPEGFALYTGESASELPTYLLAIAVTDWVRLAEDGDDRLVPHFLYEEDAGKARAALSLHAEWIDLMEETFGPYPYAKYCVVQIPTRWGGMENAGNTYLAEAIFDFDRAGVGTIAHELVHQWFGNGVGYGPWVDIWLGEGFASYFGPWLDAATGGPPLERSLAGMRARWLRSPVADALPVRWDGFPDPANALNANTYPKGAWILHMLRGELGDEAFFAGLRRYFTTHSGSSVTTEDLRAALEAESGRDLAPFFDQWLNRPGCPRLDFAWSDTGVTVRQTQEEPFDFLLPLSWTGADGTEHEQRFRITETKTTLALEGAPISDGLVDPGVELLFRDVTGE